MADLVGSFAGGSSSGGTCGPVSTGQVCDLQAPASLQGSVPTPVGLGNPVNLVTGNKYQREVDLPALPGVLGLELVRHYNSGFSKPTDANGIIGRGWRLSYETDLFVRGHSLHILQADGSRLIFDRDPNDPSTCASTDPARGRITTRHTPSGPEYTWHWPEGRQLLFNAQGRLVQILAPSGEFVSLRRAPNGDLLQVIDPQGRSLHLRYLDRQSAAGNDRYQGVVAIDTPVGEYRYDYGSQKPEGSDIDPDKLLATLVRVHLPASYDHGTKRHAWTERGTTTSRVVRHYHHEDPKHPTLLTGISVQGTGSDGRYMDQRVASWAYDTNGRATKSIKGTPPDEGDGTSASAGGFEQISLDRSEPGKTIVRTHLGRTTVYRHAIIGGEYRLLEGRGDGCSACPETNVRYRYDRLGRLISVTRLDERGMPVETTQHDLDESGRIVAVSKSAYKDGKGGPKQIVSTYRYRQEPGLPSPLTVSTLRPSVVPGRTYQVQVEYNQARQPTRVHETGWRPQVGATEPAAVERITEIEYANRNGRSVPAVIRTGQGDYEERTVIEYDSRGSFPVTIRTHAGETLEFVDRFPDGRPRSIRVSDGATTLLTQIDYLPDGRMKTADQTAWQGERLVAGRRKMETRHDALARLVELRLPSHIRQIALPVSEPDMLRDPPVATTAPEAGPGAAYLTGETGSAAEREVLALVFPGGGKDGIDAGRRWLDDFGRLVAVQYHEQEASYAEYLGSSHRIRAVTDPKGVTTRLHYDERGKPASLERYDLAGERQDRIEFRYSGRHLTGQHRYYGTGESAHESVIRRSYNPFGQVTREYQQHDGRAHAIHNEYDDAGKLLKTWITEHDADGSLGRLPEIRFTYQDSEKAGHLLSAIETAAGWFGSKQVVAALDWRAPQLLSEQTSAANDAAILAGWQYGNGLVAKSSYDHDRGVAWPGALLMHENGVHSWRIESDSGGRILGIAPQVRGQHPAGAKPAHAEKADRGRSSTAVASPLLRTVADVDSAGRRLVHHRHKSRYALGWSVAGELERVDHENQLIARYRYDAQGRRISKVVPGRPDESRRFIYSGDRLVAEADAQGRIIRQYLHIGWRAVAWIEPARGLIGKVLELVQGPKIVYLHTDHRGAVTAATAEDKNVLWQARADARGNLTPLPVKAKFIEQPLRLVNQYADEETGLHYNLARYYDPTTGDFLTPDPAGFDAGYADLHAYANGDMWNLVDPDAWAAITYYLIDTARHDGVHGQRQYRWSFWIRDIATAPGVNLLYDKGGRFIRANDEAAAGGQGTPTHISWRSDQGNKQNVHQQFIDSYVNDMISPDSFTLQIDDAAAVQVMDDLKRHGDVIRKYYTCAADAERGHVPRKLVLPPVKLRNVDLHPGGKAGEHDEPGGTLVDQGEDALDCRQAMTPEQAFQRLKQAIQIKESGNKDCSRSGCPAETWNPSGTPASYGPTQFVVSTFLARMLEFSRTKAALETENAAYRTLYKQQSNMTGEERTLLGFNDSSGKSTGLEKRLEDGLLRTLHVIGGVFKGKVIVGWKNILDADTPISPADPGAVSKFAQETGFQHVNGSTSSEGYKMYVKIVRWHQLIEMLDAIKLKSDRNQNLAREHLRRDLNEKKDEYMRLFQDLEIDRIEELFPYLRVTIWNEGWQGFATAAAFTDPVLRSFLIGDKNAIFLDKRRFDIVSDREVRWRYAQYRAKYQSDDESAIAARVGYTHNTGATATNFTKVLKLEYARGLLKIWNQDRQGMRCERRRINRFSLDPR